jgi:hypothetical protein
MSAWAPGNKIDTQVKQDTLETVAKVGYAKHRFVDIAFDNKRFQGSTISAGASCCPAQKAV